VVNVTSLLGYCWYDGLEQCKPSPDLQGALSAN
jgi:hypothetical protein